MKKIAKGFRYCVCDGVQLNGLKYFYIKENTPFLMDHCTKNEPEIMSTV